MKKCSTLLLSLLAGCSLVSPPIDIPDSVRAACGAFPDENLPQTVGSVLQDRDNGVSRADSFAQFEKGCRVTQPDSSFVTACIFCGEAVYGFVYGPQ